MFLTSMSTKKYSSHTLKARYHVIVDYRSGKTNLSKLAIEHQMPRTTVNTILKKAEKIVAEYELGRNPDAKRARTHKFEALNQPLLDYFRLAREHKQQLSGDALLLKARQFARELHLENPDTITTSWISRWKERHSIVCKRLHGEAAAVDNHATESWFSDRLPELLQEFSPDNIFNADETGLFFKCLPDRTHAFKDEMCAGGKRAKDRISVLVTASMTGEKLPLLVIGKSAKPRCFKGLKKLPLNYRFNKKAWMTSEIFSEFCYELDRKMGNQGRKIALVVDNCSAHPAIKNLNNIKLIFLPPNTTAKTQPMDAGVIRCLKAHYRKEIATAQLCAYENNQPLIVDLLRCMHLLLKSWRCVSNIIGNCYRHIRFIQPAVDDLMPGPADTDDEVPLFQEIQMLKCLLL